MLLMIKTPTSKKQFVTRKQFILYNIILLPIIGFTLLAVFFGAHEYYNRITQNPGDVRAIVLNALQGLTTEAGSTPTNDMQYMPELGLKFPSSSSTPKLAYTYISSPEQVLVTSAAVKRSVEAEAHTAPNVTEFFETVPRLQNCQKIFVITTQDATPDYMDTVEKVVDVSLENGQTLHIWRNTAELCNASSTEADEILTVLTQAMSY